MRHVTLLVAIAAVMACGSSAGPSGVPAEGLTLKLRVGARQHVADDLNITFERVVNDSRCPIDVQCIVAGDAAIELRLTGGAAEARVVLHTDESRAPVDYGSYTIALTRLEPVPRSTQPTRAEDYVATLAIARP